MSIGTCGLHSGKASRILPLSLTPEPYGLTASYGFGIGSGSHVSGVYFCSCCLSRGKRLHTRVRFWFQVGTDVCSHNLISVSL
jgi:hypothetical protein